MSDLTKDQAGPPEPHRGEAAWRAEKESIAARNAQVRKAGKQQRQAQEQQAATLRAAADRLEMAVLSEKSHAR